jgi:hypothetical protein
MIVSLLAAVTLMADTPAAASAAAPAAPPGSDQKKLAKKGMLCRNEPVLGSKLPKRVCYTPEQAEERRAADRELTEYMQHSSRLPPSN